MNSTRILHVGPSEFISGICGNAVLLRGGEEAQVLSDIYSSSSSSLIIYNLQICVLSVVYSLNCC